MLERNSWKIHMFPKNIWFHSTSKKLLCDFHQFIKDILITSFNSYLTSQTKLAKFKQKVRQDAEEGACSPPPHYLGCTSGLRSGCSQTEWETQKVAAKQNSHPEEKV